MILNAIIAHDQGASRRASDDLPRFLPSLLNAAPALCLPVVILGSLVFGLATPTEGSAIAVFFALMAGQFYKGLNWRMIFDAVEATAKMTGTIFIILAAISVLGYLAGQLGWSRRWRLGRVLRTDRYEIPVFPCGHLPDRGHVHGHARRPDSADPAVCTTSNGARHQPDPPWHRAVLQSVRRSDYAAAGQMPCGRLGADNSQLLAAGLRCAALHFRSGAAVAGAGLLARDQPHVAALVRIFCELTNPKGGRPMKLKALTLAALLAMATSASAEVKIALDGKPDLETSGSYNWAYAFGNALKEAGMEVREMPRGSVGNEAEKFDQVSTGLLEVSLSDVRAVAQVDPFIYGVRLPYIFDDIAHMDRALAAGDVLYAHQRKPCQARRDPAGLAPLGPASGVITTTQAVRSPADMARPADARFG